MRFDLVVIGAGPGGYTAALRAAQLGMKVACIEKDEALGGTCLNVGCIPSKALLESSEHYSVVQHELKRHGIVIQGAKLDLATMMERKTNIVRGLTRGVASLFKKAGIAHVRGLGRLIAAGVVEVSRGAEVEKLEAERVLIATGSVAATLPGVELDGKRVLTSTEALALAEVPDHLVVIGAGVIGLELGSVWARLGARVSVIEYADQILPGMDKDLAQAAHKVFEKQGLGITLSARVTGARATTDAAEVSYEHGGKAASVTGDVVLVAVGRRPNTEGLGARELGLAMDRGGRLEVNERYETSVRGVFAIGDVIKGPMLAHKAEDEGLAAVELMAGKAGHVNYDAIPNVVYTWPEIATVGRSEAQLRNDGVEVRVGRFPFIANARAKTLGTTDGFVKVLADARTDRLLGVQIFGPRAGDLIAEAAVAMELGASAEDIARSVHAHPTLAEALREAALDVDGRALNK